MRREKRKIFISSAVDQIILTLKGLETDHYLLREWCSAISKNDIPVQKKLLKKIVQRES